MSSEHLPRLSRVVVIAVVVFLLAQIAGLIWRLNRETERLHAIQHQVVDKLAQVLTVAQAADDAARTAGQVSNEVQNVLATVKGLDPSLIDEAVRKALADAAASLRGAQGATGRTGPAGPPGPAGPSPPPATTTTTVRPGGTTTSTHPTATTTTVAPPTTTTTRPCLLRLLGVCL